GSLPPPEKITATVERQDAKYFGGKATQKEVTIAFGPPGTPEIHLLLVGPNERKKPAPEFVGMNFCGSYAPVKDPNTPLPAGRVTPNQPGVKQIRALEECRGAEADVWALEQSVEHGYAVATFYSGDVDPDRPDVREGIQPHLRKKDQADPHAWGTIAAWAWGI